MIYHSEITHNVKYKGRFNALYTVCVLCMSRSTLTERFIKNPNMQILDEKS
jgi:hypothetical protein